MQAKKENKDLGSTKYKFVDVDPDKCIGCGICELVCSMENSPRKAFNASKSRIRVIRLYPRFNFALTCRLCDRPACVRACPKKALSQSIRNGIIMVEENKCDGCGWCIKACPYGSIIMDSEKKSVTICNLCEDKKETHVFPGRTMVPQACVSWCPEQALDLVTRNRLGQKAREKAISNLVDVSES